MSHVVPISDKLRDSRETLLLDLLERHNRGDIGGIVERLGRPRIELIASGRVLDGAESVRSYFEERRHAFPDQRFEVICHHHCDRAVIAEQWMTGTHLGELHGIEPTGKRFRVRLAAIFEFDGADVVNQRLYYDAGTVVRQLA